MKLHEVQQHRLRFERYLQPSSVPEALEMLAKNRGSSRLIAGGTDLLLEMARGQRPEVDTLIDVSRLEELCQIELARDQIIIGSGVTHNEIVLSPVVVQRALPLAQACWEVGSPQLRNRATVVGNLVTGSPANDTITPLRALGATLEIASTAGSRVVDLADFHHGVRQINMADDEMVTRLRVRAMGSSERGIFVKVGLRKAQAISVVHLSLVLDFRGDEVVSAAIALGSVAPTIIRAEDAEAFLQGKRLDPESIAETARLVAELPRPIDDVRATAAYRSAELERMTIRALRALASGGQAAFFPRNPVTLGRRRLGQGSTTVNGRSPTPPPDSNSTLLDWLRELGLTGSKEGCAEGECGACTVFLDGVAVMACLVPAGRAAGAEITTIEGLAPVDGFHP
ncbi:MAG TPA: FAD binding domain-containing protein, partial [Acidimicrobiia bacterium]|nr:FAD binding domain-containing protein [Acidimicrobiia bacterium]